MKVIHASIALFFMGFLISCTAPDIHGVEYDFDPKVGFANLKTYDWMQVPEKANIDSFTVIRVKKAVDAQLQARGLRMTSDNPDFLIAEHLGSKDKVNVKNWGYRRSYRGSDRVVTYQYEEGSLILDFVDAHSKTLIWMGAAKANIYSVLTPEEREKLINQAVQRILRNFPPPSN
jgi:hypothetical protein